MYRLFLFVWFVLVIVFLFLLFFLVLVGVFVFDEVVMFWLNLIICWEFCKDD